MNARAVIVLAAALCAPACYFGSGPNVVYPSPEIRWEAVAPSPPLGPPLAASSGRVVVVSRFRSLVPNPIGGLYDHHVKNLSPLWRTYFARHPEVAIMEGFGDRLREAGLEALKDYTDSGNTELLEAPLRARNPLLVTTTVTKLRHDQIRQVMPIGDFEAVTVGVLFEVKDASGAVKATLSRELQLKWPAGQSNVLQMAGAALADSLLSDAGTRAALELAPAPARAAAILPAGGAR